MPEPFVLANSVPEIPRSFIKIQSSIKARLRKIIKRDKSSIYDQCILALAFVKPAHEYPRSGELEPRLKWGEDHTSLERWGGILPGSYLRIFVLGEAGKLVVSAQKLLGLGSRKRGNSVIAAFIEFAGDGKFEDKFEVISQKTRYALAKQTENKDINAEVRSTWILLMLFSIACRICSTTEREIALKQGHTASANCWEEAFGEIVDLDLSNAIAFYEPPAGPVRAFRQQDPGPSRFIPKRLWRLKTKKSERDRLDLVTLDPPDVPVLPWNAHFGSASIQSRLNDNPQAPNMIDVELSELMIAMGASRFTVFEEMAFVQGSTCIAVRLGVDRKKMPYWHILSTNEVQTLYADPEGFLESVKGRCTDHSLEPAHGSDVFEDSLVRVGHSLVMPEPCEEVLHLFEFVPIGGKREARGEVKRKAGRIIQGAIGWAKGVIKMAETEVQTETNLSFLGCNSKITSNWRTQADNDNVTEDHALADSIKTFKKSLATFVFVYEGLSGQVSEQNLYCIANAVANSPFVLATAADTGPPIPSVSIDKATEGGEIIYVNGNTHAPEEEPEKKPRAAPSALPDWLAELDRARRRLNQPETSPGFEWGRDNVTTLKLCSRVLISGSRLVEEGSIGGLDLVELLDHDRKERVSESPRKQPEWTKAPKLQEGLGVAVYELVKSPVVKQETLRKGRGGLIISIPGVERRFGRLYRVVEETTGIGFISADDRTSIVLRGINDTLWPQIRAAAERAAMMTWGRVYVPSDVRFGGQIPAELTYEQPVTLSRSNPFRSLTEFALCEPGRHEVVGLMLQFEGEKSTSASAGKQVNKIAQTARNFNFSGSGNIAVGEVISNDTKHK